MGKSAFKLKSGNISGGSSFKMMGSSPAPQMEGSSPMQQGKWGFVGKSLNTAYNLWKYGKTTVPKVINNPAVKESVKKVTNTRKLKGTTRIKNAENLVETVSKTKIPTTLRYKVVKSSPYWVPPVLIGAKMVKGEADKQVVPYNPDYNPNQKYDSSDSSETKETEMITFD
jgi:hypothetical protein